MRNSKLQNHKSEQGFTLVELAIVMIIIGLLITGVLKGQEMVMNTRVTSTVSQIKAIDAATSTFSDIYGGLPGDLASAGNRLPQCTTTACTTTATGTFGNGRVDATAGFDVDATTAEGRLFFAHLVAADLMSGVDLNSTTFTTAGNAFIETEISGSYFIVGFTPNGLAGGTAGNLPNLSTGTAANLAARAGHYLALSADPAAVMGQNAVTPSQAARIDRKLDDGQPNMGSVRAAGAANATTGCVSAAASTGIYNESIQNPVCDLFVRVQG